MMMERLIGSRNQPRNNQETNQGTTKKTTKELLMIVSFTKGVLLCPTMVSCVRSTTKGNNRGKQPREITVIKSNFIKRTSNQK